MDDLWQKISGMTKEQIEARILDLNYVDHWTQDQEREYHMLHSRLKELHRTQE